MDAELRRYCEMAQGFCDDVVQVAGCFRANAPGAWELAGLDALSQRQILKGRCAYLSERVLLALTPIEVVAIACGIGAWLRPRSWVWPRHDVEVVRVASRVGHGTPAALWLAGRGGLPRLDVAPAPPHAAALAVVDALVAGRAGI